MKKIADASLLGDRIFLNSRKGTRSVAALSEPIFELDISDSLEKIGCKIRECIDSFQPGNERYDSEKWKTVYDPLINLADEKNPKTFFTKVKNVPILYLDDKITFFPRDNYGWEEGFKKTKHPDIQLNYASATDEDLGRALLTAFELSRIISSPH